MTTKTTEALILKIHVADNSDVWYSDGIDVPRMATEGRDVFVSNLAKRESLHVRLLGTPQNAPLIVDLYQKYCSPRRAGTIEVASPRLCESEAERHNPAVALYRMRQCLLPPSLGGWHTVGPVDYPSYALATMLLKNRTDFCEHSRQLLLTHPVWYDLLFIPTIDPAHVIHLIAHIIDPRWFIDQRRPERLTKLKMALGLTPAHMRQVANDDTHSRANLLCRAALRCWKGDSQPSPEDMERPGNFLWRRWRHAGGGRKGDLRASQDFVYYMVRTWQQQIVASTGRNWDMFLPASLLKDHEIPAYNEHVAKRPKI